MTRRSSDGITRKCSICQQYLPMENFGLNNATYDKRDYRCKGCLREYYQARLVRYRLEVLTHYSNFAGGMCNCCGETTYEFLCIDHINGGGAAHRRVIKRRNIYEWLRSNDFPEGFQVLCHNCNEAKAYYGRCPHMVDVEVALP